MKTNKIDFKKLKEILTTAYYKKESAEVSDLWQMGVMLDIRSLDPLYTKTDYLVPLESLLWRFVPAACVLILILGAWIIQLDFVPEYEMAQTFIDNPVKSYLIQSFLINGVVL